MQVYVVADVIENSSVSQVVVVVGMRKKGLGSRKIRVDTSPAIEKNKLVGPCLPGPE